MTLEVDIEILNESGEVVETVTATVREVRDNFCFTTGEVEGPYCLVKGLDHEAGYFQCDGQSQERLSAKSVEACLSFMIPRVST